MVITNLRRRGFDGDLADNATNEQVQDTLINNVIENLRASTADLDIDFEYIYPEKENYNDFLRKVVSQLRPLGYSITTALAPKIATIGRAAL